MKNIFLIALSNMRKAKGQTASIIVLILIAASMLNLWLMLSMDYKANFDRYHDEYNAEHVTLAVDGNSDELQKFLSQTLKDDNRTTQYRLDNCMHMSGTFPYNGGKITCQLAFLNKENALTRTIGKAEIIEESNLTSGVYLPMLYKTDNITVGKPIDISLGSHKVTYTVCGFFNSIMMGSHNCVITELILTEDKYAELERSGYAPQATLCSARLTDKSESSEYEASLKGAVSKQYPNITMESNTYNIVSQSRYISQMIYSQIISAMAFFVLLIAFVVIVSNITNYIQNSMKNLGILKAMGYTSGQLVRSLLLQFSSLTLIAAVIGTGISYCLFPTVNTMMIAQTGIPYAIQFLPVPLVISLIIPSGVVVFAVCFASRRIKKIEPVMALRSGILTHNFKNNHIPLEQTKAPLTFALALKTTLSGVKHNIAVCITMLVLSLIVVFSGLMIQNVLIDATPFINLVAGETADSRINIQTEAEDDFLRQMNADARVEKLYLYTSLNVSHTGGTDADLLATMCNDFSKVNNQDIIYKGRFPKYDNEIAIAAKYAKENDMKIGDEIQITANGTRENYLICGFTQISNNLGRDCLLTRTGYERLGLLTNTSYYIHLSDKTDIDAFNLEMEKAFEGSVNTTLNIASLINASSSIYISLITIIVIAILVLSAIVVVFVLYLLVRTVLNNKQRDYGILKSLGFTTGQLILQTTLSFMPTIIVSAIIGLTVCCLIINPLTALFLSGIGVVKCTFIVPVGFVIAAGIGLVLFAFVTLCLLSLKIRKITPKSLLTGE